MAGMPKHTQIGEKDAARRRRSQAMPENADDSSLSRPLQEMPDHIRQALVERNLMRAYEERPAYQRNDYLAWIAAARLEETRAKRLQQMLDELAQGGVYMRMPHRPSA
jgi:uncharacterized protein YdeI (YjbR/CyaY-like superfamily)